MTPFFAFYVHIFKAKNMALKDSPPDQLLGQKAKGFRLGEGVLVWIGRLGDEELEGLVFTSCQAWLKKDQQLKASLHIAEIIV
jgi:hypothetical protein